MCGVDFNKKHLADLHQQMWPEHIIVKKKLKGRLIDFLLSIDVVGFLRTFGGWLLFHVIVRHFGIEFSVWEAAAAGLSIGLILQ